MGVIRKLFLLAVFVGSTYCWLVLFEFGVGGFADGFTHYHERWTENMGDKKKGKTPLPQAAPAKPKPAGKPVVSKPEGK